MKVYYDYWRVPDSYMSKKNISPGVLQRRDRGVPEICFPYRKSEKPFKPYPKGGGVKCTLEVNGIRFTGGAVCSMSDNFCYRTGRRIAKGRAMKKLQEYYTGGKDELPKTSSMGHTYTSLGDWFGTTAD